jgi:hypothetical protein
MLTALCLGGYTSAGMAWNHKRFGSLDFPIHKSHLNTITSTYGCPKRFQYEMNVLHGGGHRDPTERAIISASLACGSAAHETLARALTNAEVKAAVLAGPNAVNRSRVKATFWEELETELGGRQIEWGDTSSDDYIDMVHGALDQLHVYAADVVLLEAGFSLELEGMYFAGHTDIIYRPRWASDTLALADWKTGKTKPDPIELNHGWESGIYSAAMRHGTFLGREHVSFEQAANGQWVGTCMGRSVTRSTHWQAERDALEAGLEQLARGEQHAGTVRFDEFPSEIHHVHLRDYIPYKKAGKKAVKRAEDLAHYGLATSGDVQFKAGDRRGPAWLPVRRDEREVTRLKHRLRTVVGTVRMGRFLDLVGERCNRCPFKQQCLNDGYAPRGEELEQLTQAFAEAGLDLNND